MELIDNRKYWHWFSTLILTLIAIVVSQFFGAAIAIGIQKIEVIDLIYLFSLSSEARTVCVNEIIIKNIDIFTISSSIIGICTLWIFIKLKNNNIMHYLNFKLSKINISIVSSFLLLIVFLGCVSRVFPSDFETGFVLDIYMQTQNLPLFYLGIVVLTPIFEEFLFRGFLFKGLEKSFIGGYGAVIVSSVFFALVHGPQYNDQENAIYIILFSILPIAIFLGYTRLKTGSVFLPIIFHMANNLATCLITHFQVY